ncbi:(-)-alpha-pinene synthase-like [Prunus avium]|uniref:(-)-alpha-pinene synthase-like n=1 Tax=Prunus avium TaxID=42229 RepID=A0A6P5S3W4_PRUAV|nr:(-)-alpha-pinene synthase-like [Prunus avium]
MSIYQDEASHNETLLKLAKLDFNLVQSLHKKELSDMWCKEVDFERKLPFGRDCGIVLLDNGIKILNKVIALGKVMDDIYEAFGTYEEVEIFIEAIRRWDVNSMDELLDYMQIVYQTLLNLLNDIEDEIVKQGNAYIPSLLCKRSCKTN